MLARSTAIVSCLVCLVWGGASQARSPSLADWSGFYIGAGVGAAASHSQVSTDIASGNYFNAVDQRQFAGVLPGSMSQWSALGSLEGGYGRTFGNVYVGIEASVSGPLSDDERSVSAVYVSAAPARFTVAQAVKAHWMATLRPRLGWASGDWLAYVTGGVAVTRLKLSTTFSDDFVAGGFTGAFGQSSSENTKVGWALGFGSEYALNRFWSFKVQYLYANFGEINSSTAVVHPGSGSSVLVHSADLETHTALIGLTYRFW